METRIIQDVEGNPIFARDSFFAAGQDSFTQPPSQNPDTFTLFQNFLPSIDGVLHKRWGMARFDDGTLSLDDIRSLTEYQNAAGSTVRGVAIGVNSSAWRLVSFNASGSTQNTSIYSPASSTSSNSTAPYNVLSRGYMYFATGTSNDRMKWDGNDTSGSGTSTWGITAPSSALSASSSGSGTLTIANYRDYCYAYQNTTSGHISDISPFTRVAAFSNKTQVDLTNITVDSSSATTGTNRRVVLATSDGGSRQRLYLLTVITDNTTTTYTDTTTEATLLTQAVYGEVSDEGVEVGVFNNSRPPTDIKFPTLHRGRIYGISGRNLVYSKSLFEVSTSTSFEIGGKWEESFPAENTMPITSEQDPPVGMLSDGTYLYIGTARNIYKIIGDGPENFAPPIQLFSGVGLHSQEVWRKVYRQGELIGAMWLTPDSRVILSNFTIYQDVGFPIKDQLQSISQSNPPQPFTAQYVAYDGYNLYTLSLVVSNVSKTFVYDLDKNTWGTWTFPQNVRGTLFWLNSASLAPQWIISQIGGSATKGYLYRLLRTNATDLNSESADASTAITAKLTTPFLHMGEPLLRKHLNALEIITNAVNANTTLTITGASTAAEFTTPSTVYALASTPLTTGPLGDYLVPLAERTTKDRFYQFAWVFNDTSVSSTSAFVSSIQISFVPIHVGS